MSGVFGAIALALVRALAPEAPEDPAAALHARATKAYEAKDFERFLALEKEAMSLEPGNPRYIYNVACGEALLGRAREATQQLDRLIVWKLDMGAETDADFTAIRGTPEWAAFRSRLAGLRTPVVKSEIDFTLPDRELLACGIAVDPKTGVTYVGSLRERKILKRTRDGAVSDFVHEAQDGLLGVGSLAIDARRGLLYASATGAPHMRTRNAEEAGRTGLFAFDLASGRLARKVLLPVDGRTHVLNNLVIAGNGDVYVSDSAEPGVYRLGAAANALERAAPEGVLPGTQGLSLSDDERTLYVTNWGDGIWALDLARRTARRLDAPTGVWLGGLDGLARVPGGFVAVQLGVQPRRVVRIRLDAEGRRVASSEILEMNRPDYEEPIQGAAVGGSFFYVANSQLDLVDPKTGAFASDRARPTIVLLLPLEAGATQRHF